MRSSINVELRGAEYWPVDAREAELIGFIQKIVRIPSVTGDEGAVQAAVAAKMNEHQLEVDVWEPTPAELAPFAFHVGEFETR